MAVVIMISSSSSRSSSSSSSSYIVSMITIIESSRPLTRSLAALADLTSFRNQYEEFTRLAEARLAQIS